MARMIDLAGQRFNKLIALYSISGPRGRLWICKCDCGKITHPIQSYRLRTGETKSCGCLLKRHYENLSKAMTIHGHGKEKLMGVWYAMVSRCDNKNDKAFPNYGGRGIEVCDEWCDYMTFYNWANENGYEEGLTIDRIDNDGNYQPCNCKWSDRFEQNNNTRRNKFVTINGESRTLSQWARETGINRSTLKGRLERGVPKEELLEPVKEIEEVTGIKPKVATKGLVLDLEMYPY